MTRVTPVQTVGQKLDDVRRFEIDAEASVAIGDASPGIRKMKNVLNKPFIDVQNVFCWEIVINVLSKGRLPVCSDLEFLSSKLGP